MNKPWHLQADQGKRPLVHVLHKQLLSVPSQVMHNWLLIDYTFSAVTSNKRKVSACVWHHGFTGTAQLTMPEAHQVLTSRNRTVIPGNESIICVTPGTMKIVVWVAAIVSLQFTNIWFSEYLYMPTGGKKIQSAEKLYTIAQIFRG